MCSHISTTSSHQAHSVVPTLDILYHHLYHHPVMVKLYKLDKLADNSSRQNKQIPMNIDFIDN